MQSELNYLLEKCKIIAFSLLPICFDNTACISRGQGIQKNKTIIDVAGDAITIMMRMIK